MAVDVQEVVRLYRQDGLTMQQVAERVGVSKARVHQILKGEGVETRHGAVPRPRPPRRAGDAKAYRAYQMTVGTMTLVDRLAGALAATRTAVVTRAVEELADKYLPGWREGEAGGEGVEGMGGGVGASAEGDGGGRRKRRQRSAAAPADEATGAGPRL